MQSLSDIKLEAMRDLRKIYLAFLNPKKQNFFFIPPHLRFLIEVELVKAFPKEDVIDIIMSMVLTHTPRSMVEKEVNKAENWGAFGINHFIQVGLKDFKYVSDRLTEEEYRIKLLKLCVYLKNLRAKIKHLKRIQEEHEILDAFIQGVKYASKTN